MTLYSGFSSASASRRAVSMVFAPMPTGRIVDDTPQTQVVRPVVDDAQIRQHILDFRPVKEPRAADDPVGNAVSFQGKFHCVGLGVGAVQNGVVLEVFPPGTGEDLPRHEIALASLVRGFVYQNGVALGVGRPQLFPLASQIVGDHRVCGGEDGLSGAVVLFQADDPCAPVLLFKVQNVFDGRTPEAVDALVVVAHHADVLVAACKQGC